MTNRIAGRPSRLCSAIALALLAGTSGALADQPTPWQARFQEAATGVMQEIAWFEYYTLWFIVPITLFVLGLLAWCMYRYSEKRNPVASRTSHNTTIEVIWTVGPVVILLALAVPSFALLTSQYTPPEEPALTIKATANQWNWDYEYQVGDTFSFNSAMLQEGSRAAAGKEDRARYPRLLAVDNEVVVPVDTTVRLLVTASDVIHAFAMPAFGLKTDAVPGRINETWFKAQKEGMYYGQCSELCGQDHAYMPIAIHVVSQEAYDQWAGQAATDVPAANRALQARIESKTKLANAGN